MAKMQLTTLPSAQVSLPVEFTISAKKIHHPLAIREARSPLSPPFPTQAPISRVGPESSSFLTWTFLRPSWPTSIWLHCLTPPILPAGAPSRCKARCPSLASSLSRVFLAFPLSLCCSAPPSSHPPSSIHKCLDFLSHAVSGLCHSAPSPPSSSSLLVACPSKLDNLPGWQEYPAPSQTGFPPL